jgi:hypothetical protein
MGHGVQPRVGSVGRVRRQHVDLAPLRVFVGHALAVAGQRPAGAARQRRREAALVQVEQLQLARRRFFV